MIDMKKYETPEIAVSEMVPANVLAVSFDSVNQTENWSIEDSEDL